MVLMLLLQRLSAQNIVNTEPQLMYLKTNQFGVGLNTFGLGGINYRHGWHKTGKAQSHFETELTRVKHPKEVRRSGFSDNPVKYTYSRINTVFFLRSGFGQTKAITERPYKNALGLNYVYTVGANLALLKPVYLDVYYPNESGFGGFLVSEKFDPEKHKEVFRIYGNSNFFTGIGETSLRLGGFGKCGLSVEWGQYNEEFKTLEAGVTFDIFNNGLPMMAFLPEKNLFFGFYVNVNWGFKK
ncbi:MAG: hypothetical protein ACK4K9_04500 [Bacteroidia bacterium]